VISTDTNIKTRQQIKNNIRSHFPGRKVFAMENKLERLSTPPDKFLIAVIKAVKTEVEEI
jgi:hypothetical protein